MLNTCASGVHICSTVFSPSILGDIPSTPGDVFSFILLNFAIYITCNELIHFIIQTMNLGRSVD